MTWLRERALTVAGGLCLAGQGVLLLLAGGGSRAVRPSLGPLFLILTLLLLGVLAAGLARPRGGGPRRLLLLPLLLAAGVQLAAGVGWLRTSDPTLPPPRTAAPLTAARSALAGLPEALAELTARIAADPDLAAAAEATDGSLPRLAARWAGRWPEVQPQARRLPLALVLWRGEHRLAWSAGAEPLAAAVAAAPGADPGFTLDSGRRGWVLRQVRDLPASLTLELQIPLAGAGATSPWPMSAGGSWRRRTCRRRSRSPARRSPGSR